MARLAEKYKQEVAPALRKEFGYASVMAVPKVVINEDTSFEGAIPEDDYVSFVAQATSK